MSSIDAECVLIGILLNDASQFNEVLTKVNVGDFQDLSLRPVFQAIKMLHHDGSEITPLTVGLAIGADDSAMSKLQDLFAKCISTKSVLSWCDIVREFSVQRQLRTQIPGLNRSTKGDCIENLALYLEEVAAEIRILKLTPEYIADIIVSTNQAFTEIYRALY